MKKYIVMVDLLFSHDFLTEAYEEEYSGTLYDTREEARPEFLKAKADRNCGSAWIEEVNR